MASENERVEIHITEVFGIPVVRKYVQKASHGDLQGFNKSVNVGRWIARAFVFLMSISMVIALTAAVGVLYYPPPMLHEFADVLLTRATSWKMGMDAPKMEEWERRVNESEKLRTELEENLGKCVKEKETLSKRTGVLEGSLRQYDKRLEAKEKELDEVNGIVQQLKGELATLDKNERISKRNEEQLRMTVTTLKEQLNNGKMENEGLRRTLASEVEQMLKKISQCNKTKDEMKGTIERMKLDEKELQKKLRELQHDHSNLQTELSKAKTNLEEIPELREQIDGLDKNLTTEKGQKNAVVKQLSEQKATLTKCQDKNAIDEDTMKELQADIDLLKKAKLGLEESLATERKENDEVRQELKNSQLSFGDCQNTNMKHETANADLLQNIDRLKKRLEKC